MNEGELRALERIEIAAAADFWRSAAQPVRGALGIDVQEVGAALCFRCRDLQPTLLFRRAVGLGVDRPATTDDLDAIALHMRAMGQPWAIALAPFAQPASLANELASRGYSPGYRWMKFRRACAEAQLPDTDLRVRSLGPLDGNAFADVVAAGFGLGPQVRPWLSALPGREHWVCVAAFDAEQAIAAGAVYVEGGLAWLGFGATLSAHRRRGAQAALLVLRLNEAARRGARVAVTETGERLPDKPSASYRNILRAGFEEVYLREHFLAPPA